MIPKKKPSFDDDIYEKYLTFETCGFLDKYQVTTRKGAS